MSAIKDFSKVWYEKFPGSELPPAWEEDVKNNLAKHKQRVEELQGELQQEQVYVQFLESLLEEVEKRKAENVGDIKRDKTNSEKYQEKDISDVIKDTLERRSLMGSDHVLLATATLGNIDESSGSNDAGILAKESSTRNGSVEKLAQPIEKNGKAADSSHQTKQRTKSSEDVSAGEEGVGDDSKDHFVTVIEVNGFEKEKNDGNRKPSDDNKRLKKVPPRPPPKIIKRNVAEGGPQSLNERPVLSTFGSRDDSKGSSDRKDSTVEEGSKTENVDKKSDRPVVFDSRSGSTNVSSLVGAANNVSGGNSPIATNAPKDFPPSNPSVFPKSHPVKKFEGSKLPLPPPPAVPSSGDAESAKPRRKPFMIENETSVGRVIAPNSEKENPPMRSKKIFDLVNKMEATSQQAQRKPTEQPTPKRSFRRTFKDRLQSNSSEALVADYIDPCDAEFETVSDQIYDSPPVEVDSSTQTTTFDRQTLHSTSDTLNSHVSCQRAENGDGDMEPMYDTVAPDQEDEYVVLLEDEGALSTAENSLSGKNSLNRPGPVLGGNNGGTNNTDASTIKSQTSVLSGQSFTTTTSSGTTSDAECITGSPLPQDGHLDEGKNPTANYVNLDYFLCKSKRKDSRASGESEEDEPVLMRAISYDQDGDALDSNEGDILDSNIDDIVIDSVGNSSGSMDRSGVYNHASTRGDPRGEAATMSIADQEKIATYRLILANIATSENAYVEVLNKLLQYMKAIKATLSTSKPVLSTDEFNIIFYKIPELFAMHQKFLMGLQQKSAASLGVGTHFENLAKEVDVYGAFLQNYSRSVDTVRKCSQNNTDFAEITRSIRLRSLNINAGVSLETLLYSPVSRIQKNVEIIQDLIRHLPESHPDIISLTSALREFQSFLNEFKMVQPEQLTAGSDRSPRHLVKNSFIVELSEGHRKLRHLFLFNDVLVCAKYKASGRNEKYTFELKWYIPVADCMIIEESTEPREAAPINLVALRSQASTVRDQIKRQTSRDDSKKAKAEKQRKKLAELEAQLVLASPNLVFKVKSSNARTYTFFLSSEYERSQWVDAIEALKKQSSQPPATSQLSMNELQNWLTSSRKHLKTNMGSYLLRTGRDENLLVGDFYILIGHLTGIQRPADLYICLELDSYGHFFRKAKTKMICGSTQPCWNQDFIIELEGAQNLRILLYEEHPAQGALIRAKSTIELSKDWLSSPQDKERKINLQDYVITVSTRFIPSELTIRRVPTAKPSGLFGAKITQVCKREKRQVPFIMTSCVREIERRGINEVGIYRVSGSASDVSRLKKAFETNCYEAEQLLKEVDVHSTTSLFKCYLRELPEALFTDELYPRFFDAFNLHDTEMRKNSLIQLFVTLPPLNQHIIMFLLEHMVRINSHENHNKMSLHNLATVFGPTLLRPGTKNEGGGSMDLLAAGTADVMAQAGILYFFLTRRAAAESFQLP